MLVNFIFKGVNKYTIVSPVPAFVVDNAIEKLSHLSHTNHRRAGYAFFDGQSTGKIKSATASSTARKEKFIVKNTPR